MLSNFVEVCSNSNKYAIENNVGDWYPYIDGTWYQVCYVKANASRWVGVQNARSSESVEGTRYLGPVL